MEFVEFVEYCREKQIQFVREAGNLKVSARKEVLTADIVALIRLYKPQILDQLDSARAANHAPVESGFVGACPVLPNSHFVFQRAKPNHWNLFELYELTGPFDPALLEKSLRYVLSRHDGLRRIWQRENGSWQQVFQRLEDMSPWWHVSDLSGLSERDASLAIEAYCSDCQQSLDIEKVTFRVVYFNTGAGRKPRLLFAIHHLLIDAYSYPFLLEDLFATYLMMSMGAPVTLAPETAGINQLAQAIADHFAVKEPEWLQYWQSRAWSKYQRSSIELRYLASTQAQSAPMHFSYARLGKESSLQLKHARKNYGISPIYVLLAALMAAYKKWQGASVVFIMLTHHGRVLELDPPVELARTIGWVANYIPLLLDGSGCETIDLPARVKEQAEALFDVSLSFSCLKYMSKNPATTHWMNALPKHQLEFNFTPEVLIGSEQGKIEFGGLAIEKARESAGSDDGLLAPDQPPFADAYFENGQLHMRWGYVKTMLNEEEMARFAAMHADEVAHLLNGLQAIKNNELALDGMV